MSGWSRLYRALRDALPAQDYRLGKSAAPRRTGRRRRHRDFRRRHARTRRLVGRRRRRPLHGARAIPAAGRTGLCRLCRLARRARRSAKCRAISGARFSISTRSACRKASNCSAIRCRGATTTPKSAAAATTSSGIGRPIAQTLADMCTDAEGRHHAGGIPPPLIRPDVIARVKADARALLAPQIAEIFIRADAVLSADLRSGIAAARVRPRRARRRCGVRGAPACRRRHHQGGDRCGEPCRLHARRRRRSRRRTQRATSARSSRSAAPWSRCQRKKALYLCAQLKPKAERTADELDRDIGAVLHAHSTRSDQVGDIVAAHGLDAHF